MTGKSPLITLNNGVAMPALGLGTYGLTGARGAELVTAAIEAGYRLIDTASIYGNEREVGDGIAASGIDRPELFVQTKLWPSSFGYDQTLRAFDASRRALGLDQVDLYLLHWPVPASFEATKASYRAAERLLDEGLIRAIGVSNFNPAHLDEIIAGAAIVPAVNQIELHPFFSQPALRERHERLGIRTQSWSPLGGVIGTPSETGTGETHPLAHPTIASLAARYRKTPAQIVLRWHIDHGLSAIPKSSSPARLLENMDVFDFALSIEDLQAIDGLDTGKRCGPDPESFPSP